MADPLGLVPLGQSNTGAAYVLGEPGDPLAAAQNVNAYKDAQEAAKLAAEAKKKDQAIDAAKQLPELNYAGIWDADQAFFTNYNSGMHDWLTDQNQRGIDPNDVTSKSNIAYREMRGNFNIGVETSKGQKQNHDKFLANALANPDLYTPEDKQAWLDYAKSGGGNPLERAKLGTPVNEGYHDIDAYIKANPISKKVTKSETETASGDVAGYQVTEVDIPAIKEYVDTNFGNQEIIQPGTRYDIAHMDEGQKAELLKIANENNYSKTGADGKQYADLEQAHRDYPAPSPDSSDKFPY